MLNNTLISVIVPCYNQAQYLDECLQSVLDQTYQDWECIIVNDGSPDNTEEVAKNWLEKDTRFKYLYKENGGLSSARNAGINIAIGEWILPLDCDDKIGQRYLELASNEFNNNWTVIYCEAQYFSDRQETLQLPNFSLKELAIQNMIFCTAFFKKTSWEQVKGYDTKLIYGWEDWEFWISILKENAKVLKLEQTLFYYRIKETSMLKTLSLDSTNSKKNYSFIHIYQKHLQFFITELGTFQKIMMDKDKLERENIHLQKQLNTKRNILINKIFNFFGL